MEYISATELVKGKFANSASSFCRPTFEGHVIIREFFSQNSQQFGEGLASDATAEQPHCIRYARIADSDVIHDAPHQPDVEISGGHGNLTANSFVIISRHQRGE